ncbi:conserved Plasmodium protein, unknown function [Plasmodium knowlesi strain H]|uniref:Uncharacterized protein n=2 Tax=Plasmodium knowlesi TaxID=5850 RepID=A0A679L4Z9_PLAKH|nr:conserved Plasmodium protein, unknown function [Plasmodium knowlesi strain H]OTN65098.1 Uncharacterized protein PKNOH_S120158000 [Plasmodium knowlesi]CAA9988436.1 conserved Plasmodium protein, unknown function [Plasmodium knowlesi strain H]VVS77910.1 conserved Plasmodium protein, unknown function [Plasmodium knowlesi strain H]
MGDYKRKIPVYNDYEKKKDLLKYSFLKDGEEEQRVVQKKHATEEVQFIIKKRENMRDILIHRRDLSNRTQGDVLTERKNKLKEDNSEGYYAHEKKFPFLIDTTVKKPDITRCMRDVLNNIYEQDDVEKIRLSDDIKTKEVLLERRKELFLQELSGGEFVNVHAELFLDPQKDYIDAVKNKNKMLTLKNYGLGQSPSDFVFSYPHVKAKGRGGYATEMVKSNILKNKNEGITKRLNVYNVEDLYTGKNHEMREQAGSHSGDITTKSSSYKFFLMKNRLKYINHTRNSHFVENYLKERPRIVLRYKGFQKRL